MHLRTCLVIAAAIAIGSAGVAHAIPQLINYQGILTDGGGTPIVVSTSVEFSIWDMEVAGSQLWTETQMVTPDSEGRFNVLLGAVNPIPESAINQSEAYLGITVAADPEMTPRTRLISVAYAYRPGTVDGATGGNITSKVTIGTGHTNTGTDAFVAGESNDATGGWSTIGGGQSNEASGTHSTIAGGRSGEASAANSTVGGGLGNTASGTIGSTVGGGVSNSASFSVATVAGGQANLATDSAATVGGGRNNRARGYYSVVSGGGGGTLADSNAAIGNFSAIGGGTQNVTSGAYSVVSGGLINTATGTTSTVGGGVGNDATAPWATIPGGWHNMAAGNHAFAAGASAEALHDGSVVIVADHSPNSLNPVQSDTTGQMVLMAARSFCFTNTTGPAPFVAGRLINTISGAYLTSGGTWTNSSDANRKENFTAIDGEELLERIAALDIQRWNYRNEDPAVQHIGPTAQDFYALFQVGGDDKTISTIDPAGVALAAIKELDKRTRRIDALADENEQLRRELLELRRFLEETMTR